MFVHVSRHYTCIIAKNADGLRSLQNCRSECVYWFEACQIKLKYLSNACRFFKRALWQRLYSAKETYDFTCQMNVVIHSYVRCDTFKYVKRFIRICNLNVYVFVTSLCVLVCACAQETGTFCAKQRKQMASAVTEDSVRAREIEIRRGSERTRERRGEREASERV